MIPWSGRTLVAGVVSVVVSVLVMLAAARSDDRFPQGPLPTRVPGGPPVVYTLRVAVYPDQQSISGSVEIRYENRSLDSLGSIVFQLGSRDRKSTSSQRGSVYCVLDSLSYRGVPLEGPALIDEGIVLRAHLPAPLAPGEAGFFFATFTTVFVGEPAVDEDRWVVEGWFPRVCAYRSGQWFDPLHTPANQDFAEYARIYVDLSIDSTYDVAYAGILINERDHFGLLPQPADCEIYQDLLLNYSRGPNGESYTPMFPGGRKRFLIRQVNTTDFPFIVATRFVHDRTRFGAVTIDVCYVAREQGFDAAWATDLTCDLAGCLSKYLGPCPYPSITITTGPAQSPGPLIAIPADFSEPGLVAGALATRLATAWVGRTLPVSDTVAPLSDGLAWYAGTEILYDRFGSEAYNWIADWQQTLLADSVDLNTAKAKRFLVLPAWFHLSRQIVSDNVFWSSARSLGLSTTLGYAVPDDFLQPLRAALGKDGLSEHDIPDLLISHDARLELGPVTAEESGGFQTEVLVYSNSWKPLPFDIVGVDENGDSTVVTGTLSGKAGEREGLAATVLLKTPGRPYAFVLDPHGQLPDTNRNNNLIQLGSSRRRRYSPEAEFPAYAAPLSP